MTRLDLKDHYRRVVAALEEDHRRRLAEFDASKITANDRDEFARASEKILADGMGTASRRFGIYSDGYPDGWLSSDDPAERFCACTEMMCRFKTVTSHAIAESVSWISEYRRSFHSELRHLGLRIH